MNASIEWPDVDLRGVVQLALSRRDLVRLLAGLDSPVRGGSAGLLRVDGELVVCVTAVDA